MDGLAASASKIAREGAAGAGRFHFFGRSARRTAEAEESLRNLDTLQTQDGHAPYARASAVVRAVAAQQEDASQRNATLQAGLSAIADTSAAIATGGVCALAGLAVTLLGTLSDASRKQAAAREALGAVGPECEGLSRDVAELMDLSEEQRLVLLSRPLELSRLPLSLQQRCVEQLAQGAPPSVQALRRAADAAGVSPAETSVALRQALDAAGDLGRTSAAWERLGGKPEVLAARLEAMREMADAQGNAAAVALVDAVKELDGRLAAAGSFTPEQRHTVMQEAARRLPTASSLLFTLPLTLTDAPPETSNAHSAIAAALVAERATVAEEREGARLVEQLAAGMPLAYASERRQAIEATLGTLRQGGQSAVQRDVRVLAAVLPRLSRADDRNALADRLFSTLPASLSEEGRKLLGVLTGAAQPLGRWPRTRVIESFARTLADRPRLTCGAVAACAREALPLLWEESARGAYPGALLGGLAALGGDLLPGLVDAARSQMGAAPNDAARWTILERFLRDVEAVYDSGVLRAADPALSADKNATIERADDEVRIGNVRVPVREA